MFEHFEKNRLTIDDTSINYVIGGDGPPVLLLHGFPQNLAMWAKVAPILAKHFTVVCADLRGYGDSGKPVCEPDFANYSFKAMAWDNIGLMRMLGFDRFHMIGHDRGGRTGHRMALDFPNVIASLAVLDIVPTHTMFMEVDRHVAGAYWHWYLLSQPAPFPERMIGGDPDMFFETCIAGWGAVELEAFDQEQLAEYRRCWRDPAMIHGACSDYRAAAFIDLHDDEVSIDRKVECPALVFYGAKGVMAQCFDIPETWRSKCCSMEIESLPSGHFFIDHMPNQTAETLARFLARQRL